MARLIGWREWVALPDLNIKCIKAKADTGARSSALHAVAIRSIKIDNEEWVEFDLDSEVSRRDATPRRARVIDHRTVRDSGGHEETRVTVMTTLRMNRENWPIELTLTDRENMGFRLLLGRTALNGHFYVDPDESYLLGRRTHQGERRAERQEEE